MTDQIQVYVCNHDNTTLQFQNNGNQTAPEREKKLDIYVVCVLSFFGRCLREGVKKILSLALLDPCAVAVVASARALSAFC